MNGFNISSKARFKEIVCTSCRLCTMELYKADWCWPKYIEIKRNLLQVFVHAVVSARGRGESTHKFRQVGEFRKIFCDPYAGICFNAYDCQGSRDDCFNSFYGQVVGIPAKERNVACGYGSGWPYDEEEYWDALCGHTGKAENVIDAEYTVIKRDKEPFIFTSTGKRFLNKVEKILEDRHKPKRRTRKSSGKVDTSVKRKANNTKSNVLRSETGRSKDVGNTKRVKAAGEK